MRDFPHYMHPFSLSLSSPPPSPSPTVQERPCSAALLLIVFSCYSYLDNLTGRSLRGSRGRQGGHLPFVHRRGAPGWLFLSLAACLLPCLALILIMAIMRVALMVMTLVAAALGGVRRPQAPNKNGLDVIVKTPAGSLKVQAACDKVFLAAVFVRVHFVLLK